MMGMKRLLFLVLSLILTSNKKITCVEKAELKLGQNFNQVCESLINSQINSELYASYVYLSMAIYFDQPAVALPGFSKYFLKASDEENGHARKLMEYQNKRGGVTILHDIKKPVSQGWVSGIEAMREALELEIDVQNKLIKLHEEATKNSDANLCDFLETYFLTEQVDSIKRLTEHVTNLERVGTGLGEYLFDRETLGCEKQL